MCMTCILDSDIRCYMTKFNMTVPVSFFIIIIIFLFIYFLIFLYPSVNAGLSPRF